MITQRIRHWMRSLRPREPRAVILHYHRVTVLARDPYRLCVAPTRFAEQMEVIARRAHPLTLRQLVVSLPSGKIPKRAVVVTFDDGYADNLLEARPILERHTVPATVFVTAGAVGSEREFWWDELEQLIERTRDRRLTLEMTAQDRNHRWELNGKDNSDAVLLEMAAVLRRLDSEQKQRLLETLFAQARLTPSRRDSHRPLTADELSRLANGSLVEIGAHTLTHPSLPTLSPAEQEREIRQSKARLEQIVGRPVVGFAYPHGDRTTETVGMVRAAGFESACTCDHERVGPAADVHQLPRLLVGDWDGAEMERKLTAWMGD